MDAALIGLVALACPVGMGLMMWFMAKGMMGGGKKKEGSDDVQHLRAEQERLAGEVERLERERAGEGELAAR